MRKKTFEKVKGLTELVMELGLKHRSVEYTAFFLVDKSVFGKSRDHLTLSYSLEMSVLK